MKYFYMMCINISIFIYLSISALEAQSLPSVSKDIMILPHETTRTLVQLQMNCAHYSAQLAYLKAEDSCRTFWERLKQQPEQELTIPHVKLCGFYIGLLNERIQYNKQKRQHHSLTQMIESISTTPTPPPSTFAEEEALMVLLQTFNINANIEKSCKKAAYQNSGYAMEILGDYYEESHHFENAIYWYRRAIETYRITPRNGGISAAYALGALYALAPTHTLRHPRKAAALFLQSIALRDDSFIETYLNNKNCQNCLPLETRLQMQTLLKQHGLYAGYLDGNFGVNTIKGIMSLYQTPHKHRTAIEYFQQQAHLSLPRKPTRKRSLNTVKHATSHVQKKKPLTMVTATPSWLTE